MFHKIEDGRGGTWFTQDDSRAKNITQLLQEQGNFAGSTSRKVINSDAPTIKSVDINRIPCTCKRALEANGFIDCDNSCKKN